MSAHRAPHPVVPDASRRCLSCGHPYVRVETELGSRNRPHWRHKPIGYHWGDRARSLEAEVRMLRAQIAATAAERD